MEKVLIGAGGFAREIKSHMNIPNMKCFVSDEYYYPNENNIFPLSEFDEDKYEAIIAIGNPLDRYDVSQKLPKNTKYFKFIHPSALILDSDIEIGDGSIVCANVIITTNVKIGRHAHINLQTTIGHDVIIGDFFTSAPGVKISGNCKIHDMVYIGTNASIKEKISIHSLSTIGLNAGVVKHIEQAGTYVGTPAKKI
jgi:sugar O-acyltransferase (sialic acid O-acetyltransferase NeuD family)